MGLRMEVFWVFEDLMWLEGTVVGIILEMLKVCMDCGVVDVNYCEYE